MKKMLTEAAVVAVGVGQFAASNVQAATTQSVTRYAVTQTNIRSGPSTTSKIVDTVHSGVAISGVILPSGWIKITAPSEDAGQYVSSSVLSKVGPASGGIVGNTITGWVASSDHPINVRSGPGLNFGIVSHIAAASKISGTLTGDWIKVAGGYINRGLVETKSANIYGVNGYVPSADMCAIPLAYNTQEKVSPNYTASTARYLNCQAVNALNSLEAAYNAQFGHYALIDLAYRSHAEEVYWKNARPKAASPVGTSNHGWGLAIDFREIDDANGNEVKSGEFYWDQPGYTWLAANASTYGFAGDPVYHGMPYESYHWNFAG